MVAVANAIAGCSASNEIEPSTTPVSAVISGELKPGEAVYIPVAASARPERLRRDKDNQQALETRNASTCCLRTGD